MTEILRDGLCGRLCHEKFLFLLLFFARGPLAFRPVNHNPREGIGALGAKTRDLNNNLISTGGSSALARHFSAFLTSIAEENYGRSCRNSGQNISDGTN